jgi:hypothetical protein
MFGQRRKKVRFFQFFNFSYLFSHDTLPFLSSLCRQIKIILLPRLSKSKRKEAQQREEGEKEEDKEEEEER